MPVIADLLDPLEDDDGKPKELADLLASAKGLLSNPLEKEIALFRKMQSTIFPDSAIRSAALGSSAYAMGLSQEIAQINRAMAGITSSLSVSLRLESELSQLNRAAGLAAQTAAHNYVPGIYKFFLDSQFRVQSHLETCKRAFESAVPNFLFKQDILARNISALQESVYAAGIGKNFFRENYSNAIQTISASVFSAQGLMLESVRRVLENERFAFDTAALLSTQGILEDFAANAKAIFDHSHITFEADLFQKAIAPFVRQWAWLACEVRLVSVDVAHDKAHLLYAEYDRDTVTELLTARFALEAAEADISISSSGNLEQPNDLFDCSGEHDGHHVDFDGKTILNSKDSGSTNKALSQCLDELRKDGVFDEDEWTKSKRMPGERKSSSVRISQT